MCASRNPADGSSARAPSCVRIVRNGEERPVWDLNRGDRIAWRDYDPVRRCYVFHVVTELPPSSEVADWHAAAES
jgi:hypothetical protein